MGPLELPDLSYSACIPDNASERVAIASEPTRMGGPAGPRFCDMKTRMFSIVTMHGLVLAHLQACVTLVTVSDRDERDGRSSSRGSKPFELQAAVQAGGDRSPAAPPEGRGPWQWARGLHPTVTHAVSLSGMMLLLSNVHDVHHAH